jgi:hypothetical protein
VLTRVVQAKLVTSPAAPGSEPPARDPVAADWRGPTKPIPTPDSVIGVKLPGSLITIPMDTNYRYRNFQTHAISGPCDIDMSGNTSVVWNADQTAIIVNTYARDHCKFNVTADKYKTG